MITELAAVVVLAPFGAALAGLLGGRRLPHGAAGFAIAGGGLASVAAALVALGTAGWGPAAATGPRVAAIPFTPTGGVPIDLGVRVDGLSAVVAVMVAVVALAVQVYSVGYMRAERRYPSYAALVSLFTAAMLLVVLSADLLTLYVGWEVMGICSYFLIGHRWEDRPTSAAAVKAFLLTRLGDVGFLFGIFVLGVAAGSFRVGDVLTAVPAMPAPALLAGTLLLVVGVVGKSAQLPLHTWLPDAMAGPTPVSALIHAATMVAAGGYIVARLHPVFLAAPVTLDVLGVLAGLSMVGAALAALAQDDLKRVLAYSTISQIAYMLAALAVGSRSAAVFHLLTHAAFKALLFLCAGAVLHTLGTNLMSEMGGLRRGMPVTFATMTVGFAALIGLPPASGFFSKDAVIAAASNAAAPVGAGAEPVARGTAVFVLACALAAVAVTAAYSARAWLRAFFGPAPQGAAVHEPPGMMRWPLLVLAVPALGLGFATLGSGPGVAAPELHPATAAASVGLLLLGAGGVYAYWRRDPAADPASALGRVRPLFAHGFYVDTGYTHSVTRPVQALAREVAGFDEGVLGDAVTGVGRGARRLGGVARLAQNGNPQTYVTGVLAGALVIAVGVVVLG